MDGPKPAGRLDPDETLAWAVLAGVSGVGAVTLSRLVGRLGTAGAVLDAASRPNGAGILVAASEAEDGGAPTMTARIVAAIAAAAAERAPAARRIRDVGLEVVALPDARYPARLRRVEHPPPVLYVRGDITALDRPRAVAVVGTRRPTDAGRALAGHIAEALVVHRVTVLSGLAYGIDAAAHASVLRAGGITVAVIGGGHARLYPAGNLGLAAAMVRDGGAVASEFGPDVQPTRGTFPRRNRIVSGLADATVVVEAGMRSGALTTAAWALVQGRALYLVPGRPGDPSVAGSLAFLREVPGESQIVAGVPELLEDLGLVDTDARGGEEPGGGPAVGSAARVAMAALGDVERQVAGALVAGAETVDALVAATRLAPATVLATITILELRGLVAGTFGRYRPSGALAAMTSRTSLVAVSKVR